MKLEKPMIDFIELESTDTITTSSCPDAVSFSKGTYDYCAEGAKWNFVGPDCPASVDKYHEDP